MVDDRFHVRFHSRIKRDISCPDPQLIRTRDKRDGDSLTVCVCCVFRFLAPVCYLRNENLIPLKASPLLVEVEKKLCSVLWSSH